MNDSDNATEPFRLLTSTEVAEWFQLQVDTVYSLVAKEDLPAVKISGQWRFEPEKIRLWLTSRSVNQSTSDSRDFEGGTL